MTDLDIMSCIRGSFTDITPKEATNMMIERMMKNLGSWSLTFKCYMIFHRCLQDSNISPRLSANLRAKAHLLHSFSKKHSDQNFDAQLFEDVGKAYVHYFKAMCEFKSQSEIINLKMSDVSNKARQISVSEILKNYEFIDALISRGFSMFQNQTFMLRYRLMTMVAHLLLIDLIQAYKVYYILVTEILERFGSLSLD